ncbi:MAG: copper homeostasis periplasmic binding protein CopC [Alphaproteobacteria bacterium]|nr:copper homeostasis periplasmic binding protein CopC [Alphaproteobacteria bacterium]
MRVFAVAFVLLGLACFDGRASAHAFLNRAVPPVGGSVSTPPKELRLFFSEGIELRFSGVTLATADGKAVATAAAQLDPGDNHQLVLPLPALAPGNYKVTWHVVSVDTHRTEGDFTFTVRP